MDENAFPPIGEIDPKLSKAEFEARFHLPLLHVIGQHAQRLQEYQKANHFEGEGLFDWAKKGFEVVKNVIQNVSKPQPAGYTTIQNLLKDHGTATVNSITIYRAPIQSYINSVLNTLSAGTFDKALKEQQYDNLFHLYSIITLSDGYSFRFEKKDYVSVDPVNIDPNSEKQDVQITNKITLNDFVNNTIKKMGEDNFYKYSAFDHNCQDFMINLLQANNLLNDTLKTFILQDAGAILKKLPSYMNSIANTATNVANFFNKLKGKGDFDDDHVVSEDEELEENKEGGKIVIKRKGDLKQFGYSSKKPSKERKQAISKAIAQYGHLSISRKLQALANLNVNKPELNKIFSKDAKYARSLGEQQITSQK